MHLNGSGDNRETVVIVRASNYLGKLSGMGFHKILQKMNLTNITTRHIKQGTTKLLITSCGRGTWFGTLSTRPADLTLAV
jgi:hypothetical protein